MLNIKNIEMQIILHAKTIQPIQTNTHINNIIQV
jgi:hypothetical protein